MKKTHAILAAGMALMFLLSGCKEIETTTQIYDDASIERTFIVNQEAKVLTECCFTLPVDSTWQITAAPAAKESKDVSTTARKKFANVGLLQQAYAQACARPYQVQIGIEVEKKFRWFYTYYSYRETYRAYNPFLLLPKSGYLTEGELAAWIAAPDSDDTQDDKVESWLLAGLFEEFYQSLIASAAKLNDPELTSARIETKKAQLRIALLDSVKGDDLDNISAVCEKVLGTPAVQKLRPAIDSTYNVVDKKLQFDDDVRHAKYLNRVVMPGQVWASNGQIIGQTKVEWPVSSKQFFFDDYTMWAQSRKVNRGMIPLSVGIALLALAGLIVPRLRRRTS
jgi:hypothetical protein